MNIEQLFVYIYGTYLFMRVELQFRDSSFGYKLFLATSWEIIFYYVMKANLMLYERKTQETKSKLWS